MTDTLEKELRAAFARLDHEAIARIEAEGGPPASDHARIAYAFARLAVGDTGGADALLSAVGGDGTASLADFAYVRAFRSESAGDRQAVVELLTQHLADPRATHGPRMRLRVADALLKLRRYQEMMAALEPLLQPPGTDQTLEAHLIVLEGMIAWKEEREKLIEFLAVVDLLVERGFRLSEAGNVVYYARLFHDNRIEPPVAALLTAHGDKLDVYTTTDEDEIFFLLVAGEKYKAPAAVRSAGKSYSAQPFAWKDVEPERAAYLFAAHEEHDAARLSILRTVPKSRIDKDVAMWGPLMLETYQCGLWKDTLEMIRDHRAEIARLPMAPHIATIRAVCEYQLGRLDESLSHIAGQGADFHANSSGHEAICEALALARVGRLAEFHSAVERAFAARPGDGDFANEYASTLINELMIRELHDALALWLDFVPRILPPETLPAMQFRLGEITLEWAMPAATATLADTLRAAGHLTYARLLDAQLAEHRGDADAMEHSLAAAIAEPAPLRADEVPLYRARARRRLGKIDAAIADLDAQLADPAAARRHIALGMRAGIARDRGEDSARIDDLLRQAGEVVRERARSRDEASVMTFEVQQTFHGDSPAAMLAGAREAERRQPGNVETLRLARRAARAHAAPAEVAREAAALEAKWIAGNLS